ncbi:hypothetical protein AG1IA_09899 [Rhizoctonia solani AG-1 IA]|uniref:Uncharacterized protein n=1 Tax=Thanatephorus cucumeris (strain AG1-IA) TaxID=983506 RepID=L8WD09_THACA|nr:hypothetical protein AG1IA_09899 [Rhizoctonia solani AG-1 IA]
MVFWRGLYPASLAIERGKKICGLFPRAARNHHQNTDHSGMSRTYEQCDDGANDAPNSAQHGEQVRPERRLVDVVVVRLDSIGSKSEQGKNKHEPEHDANDLEFSSWNVLSLTTTSGSAPSFLTRRRNAGKSQSTRRNQSVMSNEPIEPTKIVHASHFSGFSRVNTAMIGRPVMASTLPTTQHLSTIKCISTARLCRTDVDQEQPETKFLEVRNNFKCPGNAKCNINRLDPVSLRVRPELVRPRNDPDCRDRRIPFFVLYYRLRADMSAGSREYCHRRHRQNLNRVWPCGPRSPSSRA